MLVVDDEVYVREITKETLGAFGYQVLTARDGVEAMTAYEENRGKINVVLADMIMPNMDGAALIRSLRQMDPKVKIIAASGFPDTENIPEITSSSVQAFLPKPFTAEKLLNILKTVLQ